MQIVHDFPYKVTQTPELGIIMPDGCRLSARLWLPEGAGHWNTSPTASATARLPRDAELMHPYFAGHGYACLRVDMRGNGDSEGLMPTNTPRRNWPMPVDVIAGPRRRAGVRGKVGMMGKSWGGFNCLHGGLSAPARAGGGDFGLFHHRPFCR
jgi:uncharacterized protein